MGPSRQPRLLRPAPHRAADRADQQGWPGPRAATAGFRSAAGSDRTAGHAPAEHAAARLPAAASAHPARGADGETGHPRRGADAGDEETTFPARPALRGAGLHHRGLPGDRRAGRCRAVRASRRQQQGRRGGGMRGQGPGHRVVRGGAVDAVAVTHQALHQHLGVDGGQPGPRRQGHEDRHQHSQRPAQGHAGLQGHHRIARRDHHLDLRWHQGIRPERHSRAGTLRHQHA